MKNEFARGIKKRKRTTKKTGEQGRSLLQCNPLHRAFCSCWAIPIWLLNLGSPLHLHSWGQWCHLQSFEAEGEEAASLHFNWSSLNWADCWVRAVHENNTYIYIPTPTPRNSPCFTSLSSTTAHHNVPSTLILQLPSRDFLQELYSPGCLLAFVNATLFIWNILFTSTSQRYYLQHSDISSNSQATLVSLIYAHQPENISSHHAVTNLLVRFPKSIISSFWLEAYYFPSFNF